MSFIVPPPLNAISTDPLEVVLTVARQQKAALVDALNRTAQRTGRRRFDVFSPGGRTDRPIASIPLTSSTRLSPAQIALQFCAAMLADPVVFADEVRRVAFGQPRGLEGDPDDLFLDGRDPSGDEQRLLGFLDPVSVTILVALIGLGAALVPVVLPPLIQIVQQTAGNFIAPIVNGAAGPVDDGSARVDGVVSVRASPGALDALEAFRDPLVLGAVAVGAFIVLRYYL